MLGEHLEQRRKVHLVVRQTRGLERARPPDEAALTIRLTEQTREREAQWEAGGNLHVVELFMREEGLLH